MFNKLILFLSILFQFQNFVPEKSSLFVPEKLPSFKPIKIFRGEDEILYIESSEFDKLVYIAWNAAFAVNPNARIINITKENFRDLSDEVLAVVFNEFLILLEYQYLNICLIDCDDRIKNLFINFIKEDKNLKYNGIKLIVSDYKKN